VAKKETKPKPKPVVDELQSALAHLCVESPAEAADADASRRSTPRSDLRSEPRTGMPGALSGAAVSPPVPNPRKQGHFLFCAPYDDGVDLCSAGCIPIIADGDEIWALLQVEDMQVKPGEWKPALAMFGGKVDAADKDWRMTAARELGEETGGLVDGTDVMESMREYTGPTVEAELRAEFSVYVPESKYQVMFWMVPSELHKTMLELPATYEDAFHGTIVKWTRAARRLQWVRLTRDHGTWAIEQNQSTQLPLKVELQGALKRARFTPA